LKLFIFQRAKKSTVSWMYRHPHLGAVLAAETK